MSTFALRSLRAGAVTIAASGAIAALLVAQTSEADPPGIHVTAARIGCLRKQLTPNLTSMVAGFCEGKQTCDFRAPDENTYRRAGVHAETETFCSQGMEITYTCPGNPARTVNVEGDAWNHPPAHLQCVPVPVNHDPEGITITKARIGCLRKQQDGNLTTLVASACNGRRACSYQAPTEAQYRAAGVHAETESFCSQGMEITYRCGSNGPQTVSVEGDAWNHGPAQIQCGTVASDEVTLNDLPDEPCEVSWPANNRPTKYFVTPADMLDWSPHDADTFPILNHPPEPATRAMYNTTSSRVGSPGSTIGANEGRLVPYLRKVAEARDPNVAICEGAKAFANQSAGSPFNLPRPTGGDWGNAMADMAVTGRQAYFRFHGSPPTLASVRPSCAGVTDADITRALSRAYAVANAIRVDAAGEQPSAARRSLGWIGVSGEDDKPHRPVNVPTAPFPQFEIDVNVNGIAGTVSTVHTRYMIAHARPPMFPAMPARGTGATQLRGDLLPALATDAQVVLFIHGMDSRVEEALNLTGALHRIAREAGGKNWTVISLDMPTSGYADSLDENIFGPAGDVGCHHTPQVDFLENFIVRFVDDLDQRVGGALKPRIRTIVGGSMGGSMSMRLGRRNFLPGARPEPWIRTVVPWSPASIWPPKTNRRGVTAGCDKPHSVNDDIAIGWPRGAADQQERVQDRRNFFYGSFDWNPPTQKPQAQYWWRDGWGGGGGLGVCKTSEMVGARVDRHETYDALFRKWRWRLAAEQLAFSHRQNQGPDATRGELADPLFLYNRTPTLLIAGQLDIGGDLGKWAHDTAPLMKNTPGKFRWLGNTGHSLDDERPMWVAREIVQFLSEHEH
jgi:hypothetical protein